jgi:uncharacterized membrane protein (TIGR02234 family)
VTSSGGEESRRRELTTVVALAVLGAAVTLVAAGRGWAEAVVRQPPLAPVEVTLSGRAVAPLTAALGLAALGGAVALIAARGRLRLVVGVVVALIGAGVVGSAATVSAADVRDGSALRDRASAAALRDAVVVVRLEPWRHVAAAGGLVLVASGLLTAARGRTWASMGRRYDAPAATRAAPQDDVDMWERLDRGDDPTE